MKLSPLVYRTLLLIPFLAGSLAAGEIRSWDELPLSDSGRRSAIQESIRASLPSRWDPQSGGLAPAAGETPSFFRSAQALLSIWDDPDPASIPREEWTRELLKKMEASQIRDPAEADPDAYPHALYGSIPYPGWLPPDQWPRPPEQYAWDVSLPPLLIALQLYHGDELPEDCRVILEDLIRYSADGALKTWAAALAEKPDLLGETHTTLGYLTTLILGGEISGETEARAAGITAFRDLRTAVRRRGVHEYASPSRMATDLDLLGLLADEETGSLGGDAVNLWLYFWTDTVLSLHRDADGRFAMGGPSSWNTHPLNPGGDMLSWLYLAGLNPEAPEINETLALRATMDRRPPDALLALAVTEDTQEIAACWGDAPGEDRSWIRDNGILLGVASATSGIVDRQVAVELEPEYSSIHLAADRGSGTGGLPEGEATGHNPMLITAVRRGFSIAALGEIYPFDPEERVTPMLYLPLGDGDLQSSLGVLHPPAPGTEKEWTLVSGDWVGIPTASWWIVASAHDLGPDNIRLRCPADEVRGHRVLRLEIHPLYQGQTVLAAFFLSLVSRQRAPQAADLRNLMAETGLSYRMSAVGPVLEAENGVVEGSLRAMYDVRNNIPAERDPLPDVSCSGDGPLRTAGLSWNVSGLQIGADENLLLIALPRIPSPRQAEGRAD